MDRAVCCRSSDIREAVENSQFGNESGRNQIEEMLSPQIYQPEVDSRGFCALESESTGHDVGRRSDADGCQSAIRRRDGDHRGLQYQSISQSRRIRHLRELPHVNGGNDSMDRLG